MNWPMSSTLLTWLLQVSGALTSSTEELAVMAIAVLSCSIPGFRAARIKPVEVLTAE